MQKARLDFLRRLAQAVRLVSVDYDAITPPGYTLDNFGLELKGSKKNILIANKPIWISRSGIEIDGSDARWLELSSIDASGREIKTWLDRRSVFDRARLFGVASLGFPVTSENAAALVHYFAAQESLIAQNGAIPIRIVPRFQAVQIPTETNTVWGYAIGADWVGPKSLPHEIKPGLEQHAKAWGRKGTVEGWLSKWREVIAGAPCNRWLISAAFASPIVRILGQRTFILHHYGASSRGKSAIAFFAQSAFGSKRTALTFYGTQIGRIEAVQACSDLPCLFDELQVADRDPSAPDHRKFIYAVCNESPRVRSGQMGGVQRAWSDWKTIVRTTGEEPILRWTRLAGEANRVLEFETPSFDATDQAADLHKWIDREDHVGEAGRAFLSQLSRRATFDPESIRGAFADHVASLEDTGIDPRRKGWISTITTAEQLFLEFLLGYDPERAAQIASEDGRRMAQILAATPIDSDAERFLGWLISHRSANPGLYTTATHLGSGEDLPRKIVGVEYPGELVYFPTEINVEASKAGFICEAAWRALRISGNLITDEPGRNEIKKRIAGRRQRVYAVRK